MDGVYPTTYCNKQPLSCKDGKSVNNGGGVWVSNSFIRNRGQPSFATMGYDEGYPDYLTNNPPPVPLYVRVAPSQFDASKKVYWINGWERPRLVLTRGKKYQFNVMTCGYPFYFGKDLKSTGIDNITKVPPTDYNVSTFTMNPGVTDKFYYKCSLYPDMGGEVIIK
jgi:hypothetical protein